MLREEEVTEEERPTWAAIFSAEELWSDERSPFLSPDGLYVTGFGYGYGESGLTNVYHR